MADEVKNDRITDESIDDELDLGSLDDIELDAAIDGDGGVKKGKGRHPSTSTKTKAVDFVKGAVGGVASGAGDAIMNAMPEARVIASNVTDTLNDIQALRDDLSKQLAPLGLAVENATRKFLPKVEKVLPKTAYQKIKKKLDDRADARKSSEYTPESQATIDANTIKSELESVFGAQTEATLETARLTEKNVLIDRALGSMRHKQMTFQLVHLYDAMRSTELFHKTQHMAYMKKSLELKYKHVFIARDTLNLLRQSLAMQEGYMKAIVDNTALPDMMKQKAGDFVYGSRTKQYGEMMGSALGNIRGKIINQLKNVKDQLVGSMQMATDGLNLYSDMSGMADEFGGGGGPNIAKFVGKGLGYAGGLLGIGPAIQGSKVAGALNQRLAGVRSSMATKMSDLKERWGIGNSSNPVLNAISALLPNPFAPQKAASNDLISSPEKAVAFDLLTRQSITEIIPGYLSKIWHEVEMLRTGDETSEEKVYNVFDRSFTSAGDVRKSLYAQAFGSESSRKEAASRAIGIITAGTARNNSEKLKTEPDLKKYAKDINQVFINHAVEVQPFRPADILNYCMSGVESPYITKIINGVNDPAKVLEVIKDSIYHDRELDSGVVNTIISIIDEHYRKSDAHKVVLAKARELYGYNDLIKKDGLIKSSIRGTAEMNLKKIAGIQGSMVKDESDIDESISEKVHSNTIEGLGEYDAFMNPIISKAKAAKQYAKDKLSRAGTSVKNAASASVETATSTLGKAVAAPMASIKGSVDRFMPEWMRTASDSIGKHIAETKDLISDVSSNIVNPAISNIASATKKTASSVMEQRRKEVARKREAEKKVDELDRIVFDEEGAIPKPVTRSVHIQPPKPSAAPSIGGIAEELASGPKPQVVESLVSKPTTETPGASVSNDTLSAILDHLTGWKETISEEHGLIFDATAQIDETLRNLSLTGAPSPTGGMIYSASAPQSKGGRARRALGKGVKAIGKGIGAGIKNVGKLYAHVYGAALKGAGTAISGVAGAAKDIIGKVGRGAKGIAKWATHKEDYVDVYVKGKEGGMPLVSARKQREEGIYYKSTGKRVMKSADIDQPCVDKDGNLVITPEDLKAGLVMSNSSPLGKLGAGALALGKGYFSVYGKALTGIASVAKTALKVLFGAKERYVDVYRKGEISKGPLITARMQKEEGVFFFESGKRVDKSSDIHEPVCDRDRKVLVSKEDVEHGLVDVNNKPLGAGGGGLIGAMLPGLKKLGSIAGEATKSLTGIYGTAYKGILDLGIGGLKGAGKFLTRALGLDLSKGGVGDGEQTISILQKMQADLALIADQYRNKTKPGDADGDGDVDGSYADQMQKKEKSKAERVDARDLHKDVSWGKKDEESDGSGDDGDGSSLTDLLDFLPEKWKKKGRRIKRKGKALKRLGKRKLSKFGSRAAKGLGKFGGAAGKLLARGGGKALTLAAGGGTAALGALKGAGSLIGSGASSATKGIGSSLGKAAGKFAGKGLLKGAAKFLGPVGLALTAGMALSDGVSGYGRAGEIFGKDEKDLNFNDKGSAGVGSALSGLTFGLLPEKWGANIAKYTGLGALTGGAVEGTKWIGKKLGFADDMTPEEKQRYAELEEMSKSGPLYPEQQKEFDALKKKKGGFGKGLLGIGKAAVMGSPVGLAYTAGKAIFKGIKSLFSSDKDKCDSLRKQIEEKIQKDGDPTGTLNKGLTAFENYVKREQYDIALKLGKDLLGFKPGEESSKTFDLDAYEKMSKDANTLIEKIGKAQSETNGFLHPLKSMKLAGLMNIVRSGSSKWGPEFFKDTEKKLSEIMGTADYVPKPENVDDEIFEKGKELLKTIQTQNDKRSWIGSPIVKTRLNSLYNEVNSDPSSWNKETLSKWQSKLAEIDSDYTAPSTESKADSVTPASKGESVQEKIANDIGQTKIVDNGTHDTVKHTKTDSGYTAERSGIRIAGEPIRKDGLSDKQMDMISAGLQMGHVKYPAYVMEMYNKQRPEYEARIAEEIKNQPPSEFDDLFASGGIIGPAGRFATQPTPDVDGAGNRILYGEAGTEAIMPITDKPGNLLNRVGSKLGDILSGKSVGEMSTGSDMTEGSVHAGSEAAEPMENMMANELAKIVKRRKFAEGGFASNITERAAALKDGVVGALLNPIAGTALGAAIVSLYPVLVAILGPLLIGFIEILVTSAAIEAYDNGEYGKLAALLLAGGIAPAVVIAFFALLGVGVGQLGLSIVAASTVASAMSLLSGINKAMLPKFCQDAVDSALNFIDQTYVDVKTAASNTLATATSAAWNLGEGAITGSFDREAYINEKETVLSSVLNAPNRAVSNAAGWAGVGINKLVRGIGKMSGLSKDSAPDANKSDKFASGGFTNFVGNLFSKDGMGTNRELLKILVDHVEKHYEQYLRSNNYGNPFRFIAEECPIDPKDLKGFTDADITNDTIEALNHAIYENHRGEEIPKDILEKYNKYLADQEAYRKKYGSSVSYGDSVGKGLIQAEDGSKYTFEEEARDREVSNANRISENMERRIKGQFDTNRKLGFFDRMLDRNAINSLEADSVAEFAKGGFISKLGGALPVSRIGLPSILGRIGRGAQSLLNRGSSLPSTSITGLRDRGAISVPGSDRVVNNVSPRDTVTQTPSAPQSREIKSSIKLEGSDNIVATNKEMADQIRLLNQNTENLYKMMNAILSKEGIKVQGIDLLTKVVATTGSRPTQSGGNTTIIQTIPQESGIDLRKKAM